MPVQHSNNHSDGYEIAVVAIDLPDRYFTFHSLNKGPESLPSRYLPVHLSPYDQYNIPWLDFRFCGGTNAKPCASRPERFLARAEPGFGREL